MYICICLLGTVTLIAKSQGHKTILWHYNEVPNLSYNIFIYIFQKLQICPTHGTGIYVEINLRYYIMSPHRNIQISLCEYSGTLAFNLITSGAVGISHRRSVEAKCIYRRTHRPSRLLRI